MAKKRSRYKKRTREFLCRGKMHKFGDIVVKRHKISDIVTAVLENPLKSQRNPSACPRGHRISNGDRSGIGGVDKMDGNQYHFH